MVGITNGLEIKGYFKKRKFPNYLKAMEKNVVCLTEVGN